MKSLEKYHQRAKENQTLLCVGLDSDISKLPARFQAQSEPQLAFNIWIIEQTHQYVAAYKPNMAFYEARGDAGIRELKKTLEYLQSHYPEIVTIADAKRGDVETSTQGYVSYIYDYFGFDAVTLNPYQGEKALSPFLQYPDKWSIVLCRTSNSGAGEFQDLLINDEPLWAVVSRRVSKWSTAGDIGLVVGATQPAELAAVRKLVGSMTLLIPGLGTQGGSVKEVVKAGLSTGASDLVMTASRSIIFASDPSHAAQALRDEINQA